MDKSSDAFRTISEVATDLDLPQHVLRFWETRFAQIKPLKRGGGRRYYRPDDVDLLKGIRHLLYGEGYTIRGVQRILKEQGVRFVMGLWQEGAPGLQGLAPRDEADLDPADAGEEDATWTTGEREEANDIPAVPLRLTRGDDRGAAVLRHAPLDRARQAAMEASRTVSLVQVDGRNRPPSDQGGPAPVFLSRETLQTAERQAADEANALAGRSGVETPADDTIAWSEPEGEEPSPAAIAQRFAPRNVAPAPAPTMMPLMSRATPTLPPQARGSDTPTGEPRQTEWSAPMRPIGTMMEKYRPGPRQGTGTAAAAVSAGPAQGLSRDEIRRLQATLFELLECKRLLDQTR